MHYTAPDALAAFHARFAGASDRVFGPGRAEDGRSSYMMLAETVDEHAAHVLDLACGDGALLAKLMRPGREVVGLDRSPHELAAARERLGPDVPLVEASAQKMPFFNESFDAVTCHMALMFFEEPQRVVAELARVIRPGGTFAAVVGRGADRSPFAASFFQALRQAGSMDGLNIGWSMRHATEGGLLGLFQGWNPYYAPFLLTRVLPRAEVWPFLQLCFYDAGLLGDSASAWLSARVDELMDQHGVGETLEWQVGMALLTATRKG